MNLPMIVYTVGRVLVCECGLLALPLLVAGIYNEPIVIYSILITMALCLALGLAFTIKKPTNKVFYLREGCVITALSWFAISIMGSMP